MTDHTRWPWNQIVGSDISRCMNLPQRILIVTALALVFGMALFPPWRGPTDFGEATAGYRFVFWPGTSRSYLIRIDTARLGVQLLAVAALAGAAHVFLRRKRK
ncbi:MAG: hypothetical protein QOG23_1673 [Blastocatellia bacterium]|nr:hypothetical protein [Blastocatellia bacterium]